MCDYACKKLGADLALAVACTRILVDRGRSMCFQVQVPSNKGLVRVCSGHSTRKRYTRSSKR